MAELAIAGGDPVRTEPYPDWPLGNDEVVGWRSSRRGIGTGCSCGRSRRAASFAGTLAMALAVAREARPRTAARRLPVPARSAATPIQSTPWSAALVSFGRTRSRTGACQRAARR